MSCDASSAERVCSAAGAVVAPGHEAQAASVGGMGVKELDALAV